MTPGFSYDATNPMMKSEHGRVLIVDDDAEVRRSLSRLLQGGGFAVEGAQDGTTALSMLASGSYDVVLADISMPGLTGLELLRAVREHDLDLPVVLMTGAPDLDTAMLAVEYGAFRYLAKPVDLDALSKTLERATTLHRVALLRREALGIAGLSGHHLADRASLEARFDKALDLVWMAFQPIVRWRSRSVLGYEALVRSDEPTLRGPGDLFDAATRLERVHDLGRAIRSAIAGAAAKAPRDVLLFVNASATELGDDNLYAAGAPLSRIASRVVLEITERSTLESVPGLSGRIAALRELGFRVAVDDLGAGYAGLNSFVQLEPDFVKLDMTLIRDVHKSARKRSVIRGIHALCGVDLGIEVICEGVETQAELDVLAEDGLDVLQGYRFAKPERGFPPPNW
jgi:EAL domain-containing protein (putative c-di-GMP-specific phosphodiesterase class I)